MRHLLTLTAVLMLAACSNSSLESLRTTAPKGTPFQSQLAARYLQYAEQLDKDGNSSRATAFSEKGLTAAYGQDPVPEIPSGDNTDEATVTAMAESSDALYAALGATASDARPRELADAQFYYDCWVDQTQIGGQDASFCKEKFDATMAQLKPAEQAVEVPTETVEQAEQAPPAEAPPAPEPAKAEAEVHSKQLSYLVYFALNRAELNEAAKRTVEAILADLKDKKQIDIVVSGHTDTSGSDKYNMQLSLKRAAVVKKALIALGVPEAGIRTFGYGETDPVIPTTDDVVEPKNRRAEIVVN